MPSSKSNYLIFKKAIGVLVVLLLGFLLFYKFWFLRLPDRNIPNDNTLFVSPANGKVISVTKWHRDSIVLEKKGRDVLTVFTGDLGESGTLISITMNPLHVHYQRAPIGSKFFGNNYFPGKFSYALKKEGKYGFRMRNEANLLYFESATGIPYRVAQIAGIFARRIVHFNEEEDWVDQGDVIGLIKLGSQVVVIVPDDVDVIINEGDHVIEGETILGFVKLF